MPNPQLVKVYSQRRYIHTTMVQHQGVTVAFAMDDTRRILYSVLDMSGDTGDAYDAGNWADNPTELVFPNEIVEVGFAAAGAAVLPVIKRGGRVEATEQLQPAEIDPFLSSTARLGSAAPFQAVSDGTNILVFRQSIDAAHPDSVFKLPSGQVTGSAGGGGIVLVDNTLLCDRFVLAGAELRPLMEVRYRRSRQRTRPDSLRDTLGTKDMEGRSFYEPTQELTFVANLTDGAFTVLLLPTQVSGVRRWQLFARNNKTQRIDSLNIEQSGDGLFNTMGSQYYTSPDPAYASAVFERRPGTDQFTGKPLVPVVSTSGYAETALRFTGPPKYTFVALGNPAPLQFTSAAGSVEAWIRPSAVDGTILTKHDENGVLGTFTLALSDTGTVIARRGGGITLESNRPVQLNTYCHIAVTFEGDTGTLYLDGEQVAAGPLPVGTAINTDVLIGARTGGRAAWYNGEIDEIRIWNRVRRQSELAQERGVRLVGNEPGLIAYYRFDEGGGTVLFDQTDNRCDGTLINSPAWVTSNAPIGDHPGMRRESFVFAGRTVISGLAATLYFQQENVATGYGTEQKPLKKQARVLLAGVTNGPVPPAGVAGRSYVATLDFAVGRDGRLAQVPDQISLPVVGIPEPGSGLDRISALEQAIKALQTRNANDEAFLAQPAVGAQTIAAWQAEVNAAAAEVARLQDQYNKENTVTNWSYRIRNMADNSFMGVFSATGQMLRLSATMDPLSAATTFRIQDSGVRRADGRPYYLIAPLTGGYGFKAPLRVSDARPGNNSGPLIGAPPTGAPDVIFFDFQYMFGATAGPKPGSGSWARFLISVADESSTEGEIIAQSNGCRVLFRPLASAKDYPGTEDRYRTAKAGETVDPKAVRYQFQRVALASGVDGTLQTAKVRLAAIYTKIDEARMRLRLMDEARARLAAGRVELAAKQDELAVLTAGAKGSADVVLPMPYLGVDRQGLSYTGGLLAFAWTPDTPFLLDSTVGHVAMYFRGGDGQFFAAYYDTTVSRSSRTLPTDSAPLRAVSRDALVDLAGTTITVGDGDTPQRCTVTITTGTEVETFRAVPRTPVQFASVLNGNPDPASVLIGVVQQADGTTLTLTDPSIEALAGGAAVAVGGQAFLVAASTPAGSKAVVVLTGSVTGIPAGAEVRAVAYDSSWAAASRPGVSLDAGSTRVRVETATTSGSVLNCTTTELVPGRTSQWRGEAPGRAFAFDGNQTRLMLPAALLPQARTTADMTLEAWLFPDRVPQRGQVLHVNTGSDPVDTRLQLGINPAPLMSALTFDGVGGRVDCGPVPLDNTDFTIEFMAKRQAVTGRSELMIAQGDSPSVNRVLHIGFRADNTFTFAFYSNDLNIATPFTDLQWHHWAAVYDRANSLQILYRDGTEIGRRTVPSPYAGSGALTLANWAISNSSANVAMDEVRVWGRVRTVAELNADRARRLTGRESGLLRYWTFANKRATDLSPAGQDGILIGGCVQTASFFAGHQVFAALGDRFIRSRDAFPITEWEHLAVTVRQSWAVRLEGRGFLDAGRDEALNIVGDLTVEAFVRVDALGQDQGILSYGRIGDGEPGGVPYQLVVQADGKLRFSFEDLDGNPQNQVSTRGISAGTFARIAVTRKGGNEIRFYIDGSEAGTVRYDGSAPQSSPGPLEFGRARTGTAVAGLRGVLSEVRLWSVARSATDVCRDAPPRSSGLIAHWKFPENTGNITADTTNSYPARLTGATWVKSPDPAGSPAQMYRNGQYVAFDSVGSGDELRTAGPGDPQFTLGGRVAGATLQYPFSGVLEEVRIWRTLRTDEQITDNMFSRLKGEKDQLIACYSFDADSSLTAVSALRDTGLRGNNLTFGTADQQPKMVLSTAPMSTDTAQVRSALSGVTTAFQDRISGIPAVTEYADAQFDSRGVLGGVMKRCYSYRRDGAWYLITGYKIGNLITEWISQAQFDPQIIGYIEGAPPVPSENLTDPATPDLTGASTVAFRQADAVTIAQASNSADSKNFAFQASLEAVLGGEIMQITAPLGVGIGTPLLKIQGKVKFGGGYDYSHNWTSDNSVSRGVSTHRDTSVKLTGAWEDPNKILNANVGRRFLPANTGFAVVQSETVDIFAVRLAHNNALVSYRILPSPDIPRDWNIIPFPLNPRYTKQGTLDGAVGATDTGKVLDPDYPQATDRGEYSYFKPTEAYAVKRRIQREQQRLEGLYTSMSNEPVIDPSGLDSTRALNKLTNYSFAPPGGQGADVATSEVAKSFAHRNLANTYVWTAAGGFFAETSETTDTVTETMGGTYTTGWKLSGGGGLKFDGPGGSGFEFNFELSGGGTHSTTQTKSKEATHSFGLDVSCSPSGDLNRYDDQGKLVFDTNGRPVKVPGKVDAYRFMTFYLDSDKNNFEDFYGKVVDPLWLAQSQDSYAAALRQARQSTKKPPCWRIMHRVTYVSRILQPIPLPTAAPLEKAMRAENIESNYELIKRLEPYVRDAATTLDELTAATKNALAVNLPELLPNAKEITTYLAQYFGVA